MSILLDFEFLVILNLLLWGAWYTSEAYRTSPNKGANAVSIIIIVLEAIAVLFDIVFLVLKVFVH